MLIIKNMCEKTEKWEVGRKKKKKKKAHRWVITVPELLVILTGLWVMHELAFYSQLPF